MFQGYHSSGIPLSLADFFPTFHLLIFVLAAVARKIKRTCEKGCPSITDPPQDNDRRVQLLDFVNPRHGISPHFPRGEDCHPRLPLILLVMGDHWDMTAWLG